MKAWHWEITIFDNDGKLALTISLSEEQAEKVLKPLHVRVDAVSGGEFPLNDVFIGPVEDGA